MIMDTPNQRRVLNAIIAAYGVSVALEILTYRYEGVVMERMGVPHVSTRTIAGVAAAAWIARNELPELPTFVDGAARQAYWVGLIALGVNVAARLLRDGHTGSARRSPLGDITGMMTNTRNR